MSEAGGPATAAEATETGAVDAIDVGATGFGVMALDVIAERLFAPFAGETAGVPVLVHPARSRARTEAPAILLAK